MSFINIFKSLLNNKNMKKYLLLAILALLFLPFLTASAQSNRTASDPNPACVPGDGVICLTNPLGGVSTPQSLIGRVIDSVLGAVGSIALLMFVYGGLVWMTSSGNQEKVKKGRDILVWSAIGLVVIFMSYTIIRVLLTSLAS